MTDLHRRHVLHPPREGLRSSTGPRLRWLLHATTALILSACGPADEPGAPEVETWTLAPADIRIGSLEGGETSLTRVGDIDFGPRGEIYVLQPADQEVRVFDETGAFERSIGREGEGPGELMNPSTMGFLADTLWVADGRLRRITFYGLDGTHLGDMPVPLPEVGEASRASFLTLTPRGPAVASTGPGFRSELAETDHPFPVLLVSRSGEIQDTLGTRNMAHGQAMLIDSDGGQVQAIEIFQQVFADITLLDMAPDGGSLVLADRLVPDVPTGASYRLTRVTLDGDTVFSVSVPYEPVAVPAQHSDSIVERYAGSGRSASRIRDVLYLPETYPPVSDVLAGTDGTVWVAREEMPGASLTWDVFDDAGTPLARLRAPAGMSLYRADRTGVWGVVTDELDVPYVVHHPISHS